jgi:hypothetical protein
MSQKSAGVGRMEITKYLHDNYKNKNINLIYSSYANPYNPWYGLPCRFYLEKNMTDRRIKNLHELDDSLCIQGVENFLVIRKIELYDHESTKLLQQHNFIFVKQSIPKWIDNINKKYKGFEDYNMLILYKHEDNK